MQIYVDRFVSDEDTTISRIMVDNRFVCFGLEDEYRPRKVVGETRIPAGTYQVTLRKVGAFHNRYKSRFPDMHRGMLHIRNVPNFEWILIHCGNTDEDTSGCLLVGYQATVERGDMRLLSSVRAYRELYPLVVDAAANNELSIEFADNDLGVV